MKLQERPPSIEALRCAGDYCFIEDRLLMACPVCAGIFYCPHEVITRNPLTLSPSVVGPEESYRFGTSADPHEQVLAPCKHHFWVKDGEVIDAM